MPGMDRSSSSSSASPSAGGVGQGSSTGAIALAEIISDQEGEIQEGQSLLTGR